MPQATTKTLSIVRNSSSLRRFSSRTMPDPSKCPSRVRSTAAGCSWISFSMKLGKPSFSAAVKSQSTVNLRKSGGRSGWKLRMSTPSGVTVTNWSPSPEQHEQKLFQPDLQPDFRVTVDWDLTAAEKDGFPSFMERDPTSSPPCDAPLLGHLDGGTGIVWTRSA